MGAARRHGRLATVLLLAAPLAAAGCGGTAGEPAGGEQPPAAVQKLDGGKMTRVVLTAEAARRIGVRTARVRAQGGARVIPTSAVLYDPAGATWTYTSPSARVFVRRDIRVARIVGDRAFLRSGPPPGTRVVAVGAEEIWGAEYGGIKED